MKKKKRQVGPVVEIIFLALIIVAFCFVLNLLGARGFLTEPGTFETTLVVVKNIFSSAGISHILDNSLVNFQTLEPLVLIILSLIAVSILEASGLLKQIFTPLKKIKPRYVTMIVLFLGIISTIIGDYSYALLLPVAGILYNLKLFGKEYIYGVAIYIPVIIFIIIFIIQIIVVIFLLYI